MSETRHLEVTLPTGTALDALRCLQVVLGHQRTPLEALVIGTGAGGGVEASIRTGPLSDADCEQLCRRLERRELTVRQAVA